MLFNPLSALNCAMTCNPSHQTYFVRSDLPCFMIGSRRRIRIRHSVTVLGERTAAGRRKFHRRTWRIARETLLFQGN